jgi:Winged helix DNA-binding domain
LVTTPPTLTQRELNRALLARQHLLIRAQAPIPRVLERIGGIQAQYAPAMYVGLWSRIQGLTRDQLTRALEDRSVVQGTLMRATIHLVSAGDYWPFVAGIRRARREWYVRVTRGKPAVTDIEEAAEKLSRALAAGPLRRNEIEQLIGRDLLAPVGQWLDLVRVPPSGTWERRRADLFARADLWLKPAHVTEEEEGIDRLTRRYLTGFGPARPKEIADWAGLPTAAVASSLDRLRIRRFRAEDGSELVDLPRLPLPDADTPVPARFLPVWDATLLVHARRALILPEEYRPVIFTSKNPQSSPTFLVDGAVAGTWRYDGKRVVLSPFTPLPPTARRELDEEAGQLAAFHG